MSSKFWESFHLKATQIQKSECEKKCKLDDLKTESEEFKSVMVVEFDRWLENKGDVFMQRVKRFKPSDINTSMASETKPNQSPVKK